MSDIETESGHSSSSDHSGVSGSGKTRKSSMPKRLRLGSEASSPGPEEEDGDKKEMMEVRKYCLEIFVKNQATFSFCNLLLMIR